MGGEEDNLESKEGAGKGKKSEIITSKKKNRGNLGKRTRCGRLR